MARRDKQMATVAILSAIICAGCVDLTVAFPKDNLRYFWIAGAIVEAWLSLYAGALALIYYVRDGHND